MGGLIIQGASDILATFGAFMAVLIAIEIFINIIIYLREDVIHVKIVMATALMAIEFSGTSYLFILYPVSPFQPACSRNFPH